MQNTLQSREINERYKWKRSLGDQLDDWGGVGGGVLCRIEGYFQISSYYSDWLPFSLCLGAICLDTGKHMNVKTMFKPTVFLLNSTRGAPPPERPAMCWGAWSKGSIEELELQWFVTLPGASSPETVLWLGPGSTLKCFRASRVRGHFWVLFTYVLFPILLRYLTELHRTAEWR